MRKADISLSCDYQHTNRQKLLQEDHFGLVAGLTGLVEQKNKERQAIMDAVGGGDLRDTLAGFGRGQNPTCMGVQ
jgi:hypothetical protein